VSDHWLSSQFQNDIVQILSVWNFRSGLMNWLWPSSGTNKFKSKSLFSIFKSARICNVKRRYLMLRSAQSSFDDLYSIRKSSSMSQLHTQSAIEFSFTSRLCSFHSRLLPLILIFVGSAFADSHSVRLIHVRVKHVMAHSWRNLSNEELSILSSWKARAPERSRRNSHIHLVRMYIHNPISHSGLLASGRATFPFSMTSTWKAALNLGTITGTFPRKVTFRQCAHNHDALQCITFHS
jgi:hypothetical protein